MTELDIDGLLMALKEAIATGDKAVTIEAAVALAAGFLKNVARIADAVEMLAKQGMEK